MHDYGRQCSPGFLDGTTGASNIAAVVSACTGAGLTVDHYDIAGETLVLWFVEELTVSQVDVVMEFIAALDTYVYPADVLLKQGGDGLVYTQTPQSGEIIKYIGAQVGEIHVSHGQGHFTSLKAAITAHPAPDTVFILHPGVYLEDNPLSLAPGCVLKSAGNAENTVIVAQNPNANILNIQWKCSIDNVTVRGATGACGIYMSGAGSGGQGRYAAVTQCFIQNCNVAAQSDGFNLHMMGGVADTLYMREVVVSTTITSTMGFSVIRGGTIISAGLTTFGLPPIGGNPGAPIQYAYHCTGGGSKIAASITNGYYCGVGLYLDNDAQSELTLLTLKFNGAGVVIGPNGTGQTRFSVNSLEIAGSVGDDIVNYAPAALIEIHSGVFDDTKLKNPGGARINAKYGTNKNGKTRQRMLGIINVGTPAEPGKMFIGEGQTDIFTQVVLSYDNSTWTDLTALSQENQPGTNFDLIAPDGYLYIGRDSVPAGVKVDVHTARTGSVVWEYWNGTAWIEFDTMQTQSTAPFYQVDSFINAVGQYHVRFGLKSTSPLAVATYGGYNKKWVRMRGVGIDGVVSSEYCVGHTNCVKFGSDGFTEYFGMSRPVKKLTLHKSTTSGAVTQHALSVTDSLRVDANCLLAGGVGRVSVQTILPTDVDVSFPIKIVAQVVGKPDGVLPCTGDVTLTLKWQRVNSGATVYTDTGAPAHVGGIAVTRTLTNNIASEFTFVVPMSIVKVNPESGELQNIWLCVERGIDGYACDICVYDIAGWYVSAADGLHMLSY